MKVTVIGTVERSDFGVGTWALKGENGQTYELRNPPPALCQSSGKVEVKGMIREDVMSIAMIGPILEVASFRSLS